MTLEEAKTRAAAVEHAALVEMDPEKAHSLEDDLRLDILKTIAYGPPANAHLLAGVAARLGRLDYPRWTA